MMHELYVINEKWVSLIATELRIHDYISQHRQVLIKRGNLVQVFKSQVENSQDAYDLMLEAQKTLTA